MGIPIIEMEKTFSVKRKIKDCFRYTTDFSTIWEWDQTVISSNKTSDGKIGIGTKFIVLLKFGFQTLPMEYEVIEYEFPKFAILKGRSKNIAALDIITMEEEDEFSTKINWKAIIEFKGFVSTILPVIKKRIIENGQASIDNLKIALQNNFNLLPQNSPLDALILPRLWKFSKYGYSNAKKNWHPNSSSMVNKHVVITGATSGIGLAASILLANKGANLTLIARDQKKGKELKKLILEKTGNDNICIEYCDLSLIKEVKLLSSRLINKKNSIDVLINNAGALFNERKLTSEGIEQSFALLLLSPFILTNQLMSIFSENGRVINITSGGMYSQKINIDNLESTIPPYNGPIAYANCKRGLHIVTQLWAKEFENTKYTFNSMHPGWADTPGVLDSLPNFYMLTKKILRTPEEGADTIDWLASSLEVEKYSGKLFLDRSIQPSHLFSKTKESEKERIRLRNKLSEYLD